MLGNSKLKEVTNKAMNNFSNLLSQSCKSALCLLEIATTLNSLVGSVSVEKLSSLERADNKQDLPALSRPTTMTFFGRGSPHSF